MGAKIEAEPVGRVVALDERINLILWPVGETFGECVGRLFNALGSRGNHGVVASAERCFSLRKQGPQQLCFPSVPNARPNGANVAGGQHQQHLKALAALHDCCEILNGPDIREVAFLRGIRHKEMMQDQPNNGVGFRLV